MHIDFDPADIEKISGRVAEIVFENLKNTKSSSLLDSNELAEYLNVPKSWVYEKTRDKTKGSIPRVMVGKYVRFNIQDVLEWLNRH